jgi:thiol-disulfide isomerase/thioredoxin
MFTRTLLFGLGIGCFSVAPAQEERLAEVMVGDAAPQLDVGGWLKGEAVTEWKRGTVYVVDLWATWCPPCIEGMPHLTELQKKYGAKVEIVAVSIGEHDPSLVAPFVRQMGDKLGLRVARDRVAAGADRTEGAVFRDWLTASGRNGIPLCFLVDREGRIAWIGESKGLDGPLADVVAGTWDHEQARAHPAETLRRELELQKLRQAMHAAYDRGAWEESVEFCQEILELDPEGSAALAGSMFQTLFTLIRDRERALAFGYELVEGDGPKSPSALGQIAYVIVFMDQPRDEESDALAELAAREADRLGGGKLPSPLETLAHLCFERGNIKEAVSFQKRAVKAARSEKMRKAMQETLQRYEAALK